MLFLITLVLVHSQYLSFFIAMKWYINAIPNIIKAQRITIILLVRLRWIISVQISLLMGKMKNSYYDT